MTVLAPKLLRRVFRPTPVEFVPGVEAGVLLFSMRRVADLVAYCAPYEFEDTIREATSADTVHPVELERLDLFRKIYKATRHLTRSGALAARLVPRAGGVRLERSYDLFFPIFNHVYELFALDAVPDWRVHAKFAACFVSEAWPHDLPEYLIERLASFDRIYLGLASPTETFARITGRPVTYLPLGVDAIRFAPDPFAPPRGIDVCGIGRRSAVTHRALLALARERGLFYFYDTVRSKGVANATRQTTFSVTDPAEHRLLLANLLKRSRYFIANRARANEPEYTRGVEEVSGRFYEGAAAGTVMIGNPPQSEAFRKHFDWADAVIEAPVDAPEIGDVIARLDADPNRVGRIRTANVVNSVLRHDWVYRLRAVLEDARLPMPEQLLAREARLRALAEAFRVGGVS